MTAKEALQLRVTAMSETDAAALLAVLQAESDVASSSDQDLLRPLSFESLGRSGRSDLGTRHKAIRMDEFDVDPRSFA